MSVNPVVPDTCKVAVLQHVGTTNIVNTFYCNVGGSVSSGEATALDTGIEAAWAEISARLSTAWELDEVIVTDVAIVGGSQYTFSSATVGAEAANPIPPQAAAGVSWRTASVGRSYRGRSYLCGFTEADSAGNALSAGLLADLEDWAVAMETVFDSVGEFVVVSRYTLNPTPPPSSIPRGTNITTHITNHIIAPGWETQRRRARF